MAKFNLYKQTVKLLNKTKTPIAEVARQTGLGERWVHMVKRDEIGGPSVKSIQKIYDYLSK